MATSSHAQAVKSLNKSSGRKRFVFKNFSQRLEEIEINVFSSLDPIKTEPSGGSSFFHDCLVQWRELNTAEDFISFYEEMMPLVQTLPQVLLHKELIISKVLARLEMRARLSLEPMLRLIGALSRDLLEDFFPFLQRVVDSLVSLLESGADREPEIIEQIITSWSYVMMYLQKYLIIDIVHLLKVTAKLRYYPKDYVQEFMSEAVSYLLRNAPYEQLRKGVRKIMLEAVKKPLLMRKSGASALFFYAMRGTSSRFHSKAVQVLRLLMHSSISGTGDELTQGSDCVAEILITVFQRLCEELQSKELNLLWDCFCEEITKCVTNKESLHLKLLLFLLVSTVQADNGLKISDYEPMHVLLRLLVRSFIIPSNIEVEPNCLSEIVDKVLQLMLCILDGLHISNDMSTITRLSSEWAPAFKLRNPSLLNFIKPLLSKEPYVVYTFRTNILSAINSLIETSPEETIFLMLIFGERLQGNMQSSSFSAGGLEEGVSRISSFLQKALLDWTQVINKIAREDLSSASSHKVKLPMLWGIISCCSNMLGFQVDPSLLIDLVDALDQLLMAEADNVAGFPRSTWQSLIGVALSSFGKLGSSKMPAVEGTKQILHLAKQYRSSSQVLFAVAELLDSMHGLTSQENSGPRKFHPELRAAHAVEAFDIFSENLSQPNKEIRVSTLRILCHYEPLNVEPSKVHPVANAEMQLNNVLHILLSIEDTPLSISTSRKVVLSISRIQMDLSAARICESYIPVLLNGIIGIFHNRFSYLWEPAIECLAVLIIKNVGIVWDRLISYLGQCQSVFLMTHNKSEGVNMNMCSKTSELVERFNLFVNPACDSTPCATVLSLLLRCLQKISVVVESHSRQIIPLFLKFLGYMDDDIMSVGSFHKYACKGKEWKGVLKEWLTLLKVMRNPKSFYRSQFLKDVLQNRLLDENDAELQMQVLDCLLLWKDDFMLPYGQHLKNLISSKNLREELTTWSLSRESSLVEEQHRTYLVPVVIRLLVPKVRKLKTLASRKHTSVHHRKAVLAFIAQLDVNELDLLFAMLLKPLLSISKGSNITADWFWSSQANHMNEVQAFDVLKFFTVDSINALSCKKRYSFLHVIEDVLEVFDEFHVIPFLDLLMGCVVRMLRSCTSSLESAKSCAYSLVEDYSNVKLNLPEIHGVGENSIVTSTAVKQLKDLRSLSLKIISLVLNKYGNHDFGSEFWDLFFNSVKPLVDGFKQEGSSSKKPSSLFSCFVAMSKSHNLVSLLYREKNLVADIFSILTVPTASEAIISSVLKFIENLLNLDSEVDDEDSSIRKVLLPNIDTLICSLHYLFQSCYATKRKLVKYPGETEFGIFKLLLKYVKNPLQARKFIDNLLPFLGKKADNSDICVEALQVIRDIIPVSGSETCPKIMDAISPLLVSAGLDIRLVVCDLLGVLAEIDPSLLSVAKLASELNATSIVEIGGLDFDTIVHAYEKISVEFFYTISENQALVILSHCVYDMSSDELILRHSAYRLLVSFLEFSVQILRLETKSDHVIPEAMVTSTVDGCWTEACIQRMINKFLLKHMADAIVRQTSIHKEWIDLLREMVLKLPEVPDLHSFKILCSDDPEVDFFNNIIHLQKHRRSRALSRFRSAITAEGFSEVITNKIFVPLFLNMLFNVQNGKDENIRSACLETIASICGRLEWKSYYALLMRCFREMTIKPNKQKVLLRLICSILDKFHFFEICSNQEVNNSTDRVLRTCTTGIQTCLHDTVLPRIQKLLTSDSDKVNVNISLAALKLLKLLPGDIIESQLSSIIHRISNFLRNHLESIRDDARSALAACLKELGLEYLQFVVSVLRATLKRGYELHVLGYTLHFILLKCVPLSGKLDYCLEDLLSIVENDILGDVAEEKEVEKIASRMKETRKCKSIETLKLIAQSITFKSHALKLLSPITTRLQRHLTPKVKLKLETMLNHIAAGIECNPSVDQTDLFIFVYGLIEDGISKENSRGEDSAIMETNEQGKTNEQRMKGCLEMVVCSESHYAYLITVFALGLLHNRIKNMKLDKRDEQLLSMLDPFVKQLASCLNSKYEDILSVALRCIALLVRLPLPAFGTEADRVKSYLLDIAQSSINANSLLTQSCLSLLTVLLRSTKITLSTDQLHLLIQFPIFVDLERNPSFVALSLLKAIISRKLVVHKIYDVVTRVAELMVTSQEEPIRKKCSQIFLQFLLDYHLSKKRLQQHLDSLLANLRYEHSSGREAVLEMIHTIIIKFPKTIVDEQSHTFFVHLVVCLANDQDNKVRSMIGAAIKLLIGRISSHSLHPIIEYSLSWYLGEKQQLWSAAAQVLGFMIEVMKNGFQRHIKSVLPVMRKILQLAVTHGTQNQLDLSTDVAIPVWKEAYYSLVMLEKMLQQFNELCLHSDLEDIWEMICDFLLHPHIWLRNISSRLVAFYFTAVNKANREKNEKSMETFSLVRPSTLFMIAVSLCCQLKAQLADDAASNLIMQNLVFAICGVHAFMGKEEHADPLHYWNTIEQHEQEHFLKAFQLLDSRKGRSIFESLMSNSFHNHNDQGNNEDLCHLLVSSLLQKMGKIALQMEAIQMKIVFKSFRTISTTIGQEECQRYAFEMLLPLYKVCEGFSGKVILDDVKQLAQEVSESIRDKIGIQNFVQVYSDIRKKLKVKRDKRKQDEKLMAVVNPMRNAKRKLRIAAKHRAHKKRKIMTLKMGTWMGGSLKH